MLTSAIQTFVTLVINIFIMGCAMSKKCLLRLPKKQKIPTVSASSSAADVFASVATETAPSPPKPDTVIAYSKAIPATKCTKAYQGLGDFSSISFMAGERDQAYLPACLAYGGQNRFGQQIVVINSYAYCRDVYGTRIDSITGAINTITAGGEFILVYKNINGGTAYLPDTDGNFRELLDHLVTRFGEKLTKIIILHPSWHLMLCVEEQISTGLQFLCETTVRKLRMTNNEEEFS